MSRLDFCFGDEFLEIRFFFRFFRLGGVFNSFEDVSQVLMGSCMLSVMAGFGVWMCLGGGSVGVVAGKESTPTSLHSHLACMPSWSYRFVVGATKFTRGFVEYWVSFLDFLFRAKSRKFSHFSCWGRCLTSSKMLAKV